MWHINSCPPFTRQNRWQPVMLLDDLGPFASRGHLRQWEQDNGGVAKGKNYFYAHVAHRVWMCWLIRRWFRPPAQVDGRSPGGALLRTPTIGAPNSRFRRGHVTKMLLLLRNSACIFTCTDHTHSAVNLNGWWWMYETETWLVGFQVTRGESKNSSQKRLKNACIFVPFVQSSLYQEPLSVARPFGLLPTDTLLSAMAGPLFLSKRQHESSMG